MSLKIIKFEPRLGRILLIAAACLCVITSWFFIKWNFANAVSARLDTKRSEFKPVADWLTNMAPSDPETHLAAARTYQRTFDPGDLTRSLSEYEMATALSPYNFYNWIDLGKALALSGDTDGAGGAYARSLQLAPNYAAVQWAYGNWLLRQGRSDDGFSLIAKAAATNPEYLPPAVTAAMQMFDNDIEQARRSLGDTEATNAALASTLTAQMHFDEAFVVWSKLPDGDKQSKFHHLGENLSEKFAAARKFRLAANVASSIAPSPEDGPVIGQVLNGGFESGVKLRNATLFDWQIADGVQPQIALSETETRTGKYGLWMIFNSFETAAFRTVSQTIAVIPGTEYEFETFYKSDLKTSASIKWEIVNALTNAPVATTPPARISPDWTPLRVKFTMPADSDGIVLRLVREGCSGPSCPISGSLAFDDFSLLPPANK